MVKRSDTKQLLVDSIIELSDKKPIGKITVADITRNCSLSRESFYYHFKDKYELIEWMFIEYYKKIQAQYDNGNYLWEKCLVEFLMVLKKRSGFFTNALKDNNTNSFFDSFFIYTVETMENSVKVRYHLPTLSDEYSLQIRFYSYGATNITAEWLKKGCNKPVDVMAKIIKNSMSPLLIELFP